MSVSVRAASLEEIAPLRQRYVDALACQVVRDSIHARPGWTTEYAIIGEESIIGYASVAVGGPWSGMPTVYEYHVEPRWRSSAFTCFEAFLAVCRPGAMTAQSNDILATVMLHTYARDVSVEAILFADVGATSHCPDGATFRQPNPGEIGDIADPTGKWRGVVEWHGEIVATGGAHLHYNHPYADLFMETSEPHRRRGFGAFLVQELKRMCYAEGRIPAARCNVGNEASRRTLTSAGFAPCGHLLVGALDCGG
ncbi:MAG: GNAT family N-acetyltransferase [Gemmatimonadaceae bacterium]|nr:GNAT family N-acetyltransferase [Gemmatimonadaceae bacterium]